MEHFVTLFDRHYLHLGLCLYASLTRHCKNSCLWVIAMDEEVEQALSSLNLDNIKIIPLKEIETKDLLIAKAERSRVEYFWTLSAFTFETVFQRNISANRVTYIDADCYFFDNPSILLKEMEQHNAHALITEHAYDPRYDQSKNSGKYCVQFVTICNTPNGKKIMKWWQSRCIEWCYDRVEDEKFGDQKYLEKWPTLFGADVHVLIAKHRTLAPWNVQYFTNLNYGNEPVLFHFHGLRVVSKHRTQLATQYEIRGSAMKWYDLYIKEINYQISFLNNKGICAHYLPAKKSQRKILSYKGLRNILIRRTEHWTLQIPLLNISFRI